MRVLYNGFFKSSEIDFGAMNVAIVVLTNTRPVSAPIVYDVSGEEDVSAAVIKAVGELTSGCNYRYQYLGNTANVYYFG